jgi:hypothetical protein
MTVRDDVAKGLREAFSHFLGEPISEDMKQKISAAGSSFIRARLLESSFARAILPTRPHVSPRRVIVAERSDGRTCWLSVGKKWPLPVGPSGWASLPANIRHVTVCAEHPLVFRPVADDAPVTCLTCLLAGRPHPR